ncbi:DUF4259 domain-containing protein [Isoptericola jiangsuensis]|uniref:DUF4259 domain-containing protein n=1 Tax=Isoptericola jiangsuensis TaxID=548579 RepID=UPI003AAE1A84
MGTWNTGPFDNDTALDLLDEIASPEFAFDDLQWAFDDPEYLGVVGGVFAIALGALVRAVRGEPGTEVPEGFNLASFASHVTAERVAWTRAQIDRALAGSKESELYELWEETPSLDEWLLASRAAIPSDTGEAR